jgi:hypothetical protein
MLERDGFEVVGDASSTSQLARILTDEQPDIVVLDDMIGVDAVEVATEIAPDARLVVIWPAAVMPIAGAVRVEPSEVATTLTATVALAAGLSGLGAIDRPEWIERVKKDPATLREMLAAGGSLPARPSVTELQRRGHRLHPSPAASKRPARSADAAAAVVPIGLAAGTHEDAEVAAATAVPPVVESRWNRRLGVVSLASAAAAGAVMIALALGGTHAPGIVSAEPIPPVAGHAGGPPFGTGGGTQNPDGDGGTTTPTGGGQTGPGSGGASTPLGTIQVLSGGSSTGGSSTGGAPSGSGTGTGGAPSAGGTPPGGPRSSSSHLPGAHGSGRSGGAPGQSPAPGGSGDHNPHGGPPSHTPGHGGQGGTNGNGHGGGNPHGGGNGGGGTGNGNANGHGAHTNAGHGNGGRSGSHGRSADAHSHKR